MGFLFGGDGGKKQAKAITDTAAATAAADREAARGAQLTTETMVAQDKAARAASELLSRPQGQVDVSLESDGSDDATVRNKYSAANGASATPAAATSPTSTPRKQRVGLPRHAGVRI